MPDVMPESPDSGMLDPTSPVFWALLGTMVALIGLEALWSRRQNRGVYDGKETAANLGILVGMQLSRALTMGWTLLVLGAAQNLAPWHFEFSAWTVIAALLLADFVYYWQHRLMHVVPALWAFHQVHHSSPWMNLTTSYRLNWFTPLIGVFFLTPGVLLGLPVEAVALAMFTDLVFQFFLHTEAVGRLGPVEGVLNTPSAHRVHHGKNDRYIDTNFGGMLMVWDRMFGTYVPESADEPVQYGVPEGFLGHNPVKLVVVGFALWARALPRRAQRIRVRLQTR